MKRLAAFFLILGSSLAVCPPVMAGTLVTDLQCASGAVPKVVPTQAGLTWSCRPDRTERMLIDAKGKQLGPVVDFSTSGAQVIRTFTDIDGKRRNVRLLASPQGFGFWTNDKTSQNILKTNASFTAPDCTGSLLMSPDYGDAPQFKSLGEFGYPRVLDATRPDIQDLYLPVSGVPEMLPVRSAWIYYASTGSWRCLNYGPGEGPMIEYELSVPDMNKGITFPLDVKIPL